MWIGNSQLYTYNNQRRTTSYELFVFQHSLPYKLTQKTMFELMSNDDPQIAGI